MYIDSMTSDRDMYYSLEEEYQDWCSEYGLDPDSDEAHDAWDEAPLGRFGERMAPPIEYLRPKEGDGCPQCSDTLSDDGNGQTRCLSCGWDAAPLSSSTTTTNTLERNPL